MKTIILSSFLMLSLVGLSQLCPVVSPNTTLTDEDGGAPACTADSYFYYDFDESIGNDVTGCWTFSDISTCDQVYYGNSYSLTCGFCVDFTIQLNAATKSDGLAFNIVDFSQVGNGSPCQTIYDCAEGGNIGYNGLTDANLSSGGALTIEFDVYNNTYSQTYSDCIAKGDTLVDGTADLSSLCYTYWDKDSLNGNPYCPHVALVEDADRQTYEQFACVNDLGNNTVKNVSICWDPNAGASGELTVSIDGIDLFTQTDIASYFATSNVYFGFSSGYNGGFFGQNKVCGFDVTPIIPASIDLIDFEASKEGDKVQLIWSTSSEEDNKEFIIEKSINGISFYKIGIVNGNGNSDQVNKYSFNDEKPNEGANYFRIKQVDFDGKSKYYNARVVYMKDLNSINIYSFQNKVKFIGLEENESYSMLIYNTSGKLIKKEVVNSLSNVILNDFNNGLYIVQLISNSINYSEKISIFND